MEEIKVHPFDLDYSQIILHRVSPPSLSPSAGLNLQTSQGSYPLLGIEAGRRWTQGKFAS